MSRSVALGRAPLLNCHIYIYTTYILPIGCLYATYHLLREPGNSIEYMFNMSPLNMIPTLYECGFKDYLFFTPICGEMIQIRTIDVAFAANHFGKWSKSGEIPFAFSCIHRKRF